MFLKEFEKEGSMRFLGEIWRWHLVTIRKPSDRFGICGGLSVSWEIVDEIERLPCGKFKWIVSEVFRNSLGKGIKEI